MQSLYSKLFELFWSLDLPKHFCPPNGRWFLDHLEVLEAVEVLSRFYLDVAFFPVDKKNPKTRDMKISLSQITRYREVAKDRAEEKARFKMF